MDYRRRSPLRILAPLSLIAFSVACLLIVASSDVASDDDDSAPRPSEAAERRDLGSGEGGRRERSTGQDTRERELPDEYYTVKTGDTLGGIAEKNGIPIEKLQELNPELDPQNLVSGQKIKLRE